MYNLKPKVCIFFPFYNIFKRGAMGRKWGAHGHSQSFLILLTWFLVFWGESCFDRQVLWGFMHENREEREREQKFKRLNLGEEVILTWDWNLKTDIKEQKQLLCVNHWTGEEQEIFKDLCAPHEANKGLELFWSYFWWLHCCMFLLTMMLFV